MKCAVLTVMSLAVLLATVPALATELGDEAPPLKVEKWVKGGPIDLKEGKGKNIYVVEFWATWCPPCRESIPHLSKLQEKYKDKGVIVIGISTDSAKGPRATRDKVEPFVKERGEKMAYAVALDDPSGATDKAYQEAFGVEGIPNAYVINKDGKIVWQGHPMELDDVIEQVVAGKWDLEKAKKAEKERREAAARQEKIVAALSKYFDLVSADEKPKDLEKAGLEVLEAVGKEPELLNMLAWTILTEEPVKHRDLKLALKAAELANDLTKGENPAVLDTYARALFDNGRVKDAIEQQRKAVKLAGDDEEMKADLTKTLKKYEEAEKK